MAISYIANNRIKIKKSKYLRLNSCIYLYGSLLTNVTLGSGVTSIGDIAFHNAPIRQLRCYAVVPPKLTAPSFSADLVKGATLYVPAGTGMAYAESDWKVYFENIVEMEE